MAQVSVDPRQDTEFHDALRAHGIIPPKEPSRSPSPEPLGEDEVQAQRRMKATVRDIEEELETADDDEERILQNLRQQRLRELAAASSKARFGRVYPIARPDYTREVTEASKEGSSGAETDEARRGTGVVCYLYNPSMDTCKLVSKYLDTLAERHPATKFVSIVGSQCIPNYPDHNLPTLLIYRNGELRRQIIGLRREIGLDGMNTKLEDIELLLIAVGAIDPIKPGLQTQSKENSNQEASDEEETRGIRGKVEDSDDDLDRD